MNILHVKYAVEIAKTKTISKAAENLYTSQPNLSRAIKELENDLGITIFRRTPQGMVPTPDGEEFLQYARGIVAQVAAVEDIYKNQRQVNLRFSACVPRASYISYAFTKFAQSLDRSLPSEIVYKESNSMRAIHSVVREQINLGIVRYQNTFDKYYQAMVEDKGLECEILNEFSYVLAVSKNSPLAEKSSIKPGDLKPYTEITHGDPYVPTLPTIDVKKAELSEFVNKRISVFERATQFTLLEKLPDTFMWVSPNPSELLERYNLTEIKCDFNAKTYIDMLIYRKDYHLTELDKRFIGEVHAAKDKYFG